MTHRRRPSSKWGVGTGGRGRPSRWGGSTGTGGGTGGGSCGGSAPQRGEDRGSLRVRRQSKIAKIQERDHQRQFELRRLFNCALHNHEEKQCLHKDMEKEPCPTDYRDCPLKKGDK